VAQGRGGKSEAGGEKGNFLRLWGGVLLKEEAIPKREAKPLE